MHLLVGTVGLRIQHSVEAQNVLLRRLRSTPKMRDCAPLEALLARQYASAGSFLEVAVVRLSCISAFQDCSARTNATIVIDHTKT